MNKLEVGMYVRTELGEIAKIIDIRKPINVDILLFDKSLKRMIFNEAGLEIAKSSHNIIDLIEVGDYVNGYYVEDVGNTFLNIATGSNYFQKPTIFENDIKSIVTKEQMEQMKYEVE